MLYALFALIGSATPVASLVIPTSTETSTIWRGLWVTESAIAYVEASYPSPNWDMHSETGDERAWHTSVTGWVRPVSSVVKIELTGLDNGSREFDGLARTTPRYRLVFDSSSVDSVDLPFENSQRGDIRQSDLEDLVEKVRAASTGGVPS